MKFICCLAHKQAIERLLKGNMYPDAYKVNAENVGDFVKAGS